eukprot:SAG11_NODE_1866_length_4152_cov_15.643967_3_plen_149_part_00
MMRSPIAKTVRSRGDQRLDPRGDWGLAFSTTMMEGSVNATPAQGWGEAPSAPAAAPATPVVAAPTQLLDKAKAAAVAVKEHPKVQGVLNSKQVTKAKEFWAVEKNQYTIARVLISTYFLNVRFENRRAPLPLLTGGCSHCSQSESAQT